ncbi:MAG: TIM barrel protein, partial [Ferruginibacter sp.]
MLSRRNFLIGSGITAAGTLLGLDAFAGPFYKDKIGIQLFTLRDDIPKLGLAGVFKKIAAAGYNSVEMFGFGSTDGFFKNSPKKVAALLKKYGLSSPSGHYMLDLFGNDGQQTINAAKMLGHKYIVIPWFPPEQRSSIEDYKSIAERINKAAALCKKNNIKLAYHNHDFEFTKYEGGVTGYDILMKECGKNIDFELDLFWVDFAGENAIELFKKYPGRFKMWHVKDRSKTNPQVNTEVGSGSIDYKKIFAQAKLSGLEYFYVEQENFDIPSAESIKKSNRYVR